MTEVIDPTPAEAPAADDLVSAVHRILQASPEPLTLTKIRSQLPQWFRSVELEELAESLRRQVAANVLYLYPKYRSPQDRFWDRPMPVHVAALLRTTLQEGALPWSVLRRKLPGYAQSQAEPILKEQLAQGLLFRYPRMGRSAERYGLNSPDPKEYLRREIMGVFQRLEALGFKPSGLRAGALELLHEEEWSSPGEAPAQPPAGESPSTQPPAFLETVAAENQGG
jgi:hypothetical protein